MSSRRVLVSLVVAAGAVLVPAAVATAAPASASSAVVPAYSCTFNSITHVNGADWLIVHSSPSTSAPRVGQLPDGARVDFCTSSFTNSGGYDWVYGYGCNGSTKVTGWMVTNYLLFP